jgi:predicted extracellular nuclease
VKSSNDDDVLRTQNIHRTSRSASGSADKENSSKQDIDVKSDDITLADFARQVKKERKPTIDKMIFSDTTIASAESVKASASLDQYWKGDPLASAIQLLYLAQSVHEAIQTMGLSHLTADEEALRELTARSRKFVPALSELRNKAIDRALLRQYGEDIGDISSEGESSECEFAISGSDHEDAVRPESNFILPQGWRTEKFRRVREYIDPDGRRYRTMSEAWKAVNIARARENMAQRMKAKFAAVISGNDAKS